MNNVSQAVLEIVQVKYLTGYVLRLTFKDGTVRRVDFEPFLRHSQHPAIRAYLDLAKFKSYRLEHGDLLWGDYDLCFPMADLYHGVIR
jgi:hypothetical protein